MSLKRRCTNTAKEPHNSYGLREAKCGCSAGALATPQDRGLFGDMFGAMNALFGGLAFAGIIYTILLQRVELSSNVAAAERTARLSAISALLTAYAERSRYMDSRAAPQSGKVADLQSKIDLLAQRLEGELASSGESNA